jgi:hypothetical protein
MLPRDPSEKPIPVRLHGQSEKDAQPNAEEGESNLFRAEAMLAEDDRESLEGKVENAENERVPHVKKEDHALIYDQFLDLLVSMLCRAT